MSRVLALLYLLLGAAGFKTESPDGSSCPPLPGDTQQLFEALDLARPGLEAVRSAWRSGTGDAEAACRLLVEYYMGSSTAAWLRTPAVTPGTGLVGGQTDAAAFSDTYTFEIQPQCTVGGGSSGSRVEPVLGCAEEHFAQGGGWTPHAGETSRVPRIAASGNLDWMWEGGTKWQDSEFCNSLNRHHIFAQLLAAYKSTGNAVYPKAFDTILSDWLNSTTRTPSCNRAAGSSGGRLWRSLEVGIRLGGDDYVEGGWPNAFFGFQRAVQFRNSTRLAMLVSLQQHAEMLVPLIPCKWKPGDARGPCTNVITMEASGVAHAAMTFPEFKNASRWLQLASTSLQQQMAAAVYDDGVHIEQSVGYHRVCALAFDRFRNESVRTGHPVPRWFALKLEQMIDYLARVQDVRGFSAMNSDANLDYQRIMTRNWAAIFNRSDWLYIATGGRQGSVPVSADGSSIPSTLWPWTGQLLSRDGWRRHRRSEWLWMDVGPHGSGHGHNDKLSLALRYGDFPLLVDSGIAVYSGSFEWARAYVRSAKAHSTALLGGRFGQHAAFEHIEEDFAAQPLPRHSYKLSKEFDFVRASVRLDTSSDGHYHASNCTANHTRALHYVRGKSLWLVVDRMQFDRDPSHCSWSSNGGFLWTSWHVHPNATVSASCATAATLATQQRCLASVVHRSGNASLTIAMDSDVKTAIFNHSVAKGIDDTNPDVTGPPQGWYSPRYGTIIASPVLKIASAGSVCNGEFAPDHQSCPGPPNVRTRQSVTVAWALAATDGPLPPHVSLVLLESQDNSVKLEVTTPTIGTDTYILGF